MEAWLTKRQALPLPRYGQAELLKRLTQEPSFVLKHYEEHGVHIYQVDAAEMLKILRPARRVAGSLLTYHTLELCRILDRRGLKEE